MPILKKTNNFELKHSSLHILSPNYYICIMKKTIVVTLVMDSTLVKSTLVETVIFTNVESEEKALGKAIIEKMSNNILLSYKVMTVPND